MRLQKGDGTALDELLVVDGRRLYAIAYAILRKREDAEDAFQEGMLRLVRGVNKYRYQNPTSYIAAIIRNASIDIYNKKLETSVSIATIPDIAIEDFSDNSVSKHIIAQAMSALSLTERKIIYLYYFNGLTVREISCELDIPKSTVQNKLSAACDRLGAAIKDK